MPEVIDLIDDDDEQVVTSSRSNKHSNKKSNLTHFNKKNNANDIIEIDDIDDNTNNNLKPNTATSSASPPPNNLFNNNISNDNTQSSNNSTTQSDSISLEPSATTTRSSNSNKRKATSNISTATSSVQKRLLKELQTLQKENIEGVIASPTDESNLLQWTAMIDGPSESPYAGGKFALEIKFPDNYPFAPPNLKFKTKIYHCNINEQGYICLDILKDQWSPALTISKVLVSLMSLLTDPNPDSPLNGSAGSLYKRSKKQYDKQALEWTKKYAMSTNETDMLDEKKSKRRRGRSNR